MKLKIIDKAYLLLIFMITALGIIFIPKGTTIDIHIHDTKFVIAHFPICLIFLFYTLMLAGCNYWLNSFRKRVSTFQWVAFIITTLFVCLVEYSSIRRFNLVKNEYNDLSQWHAFYKFEEEDKAITILSLVFVTLHLFFWIYFFFLLFRKLLSSHKN